MYFYNRKEISYISIIIQSQVLEYIIKMGCQSSTQQKKQQNSQQRKSIIPFQISYRDIIRADIGQVFQIYHFSKIISRSSHSIIRKVINRQTKQQKVCKIISIQPQSIQYLQQVQIMRNLDHPGIVRIHQYFFDKINLYIVMEFIEGKKLTQMVTQAKTSLQQIVDIWLQLIRVLYYVHQKGIVHNAINPDNIIIIQNHEQFFLKIIDFSQASVDQSPKIGKKKFQEELKFFKDPLFGQITNKKNDIWSTAMIFLFMITQQKTFKNFYNQKKQIIRQKINLLLISTETADSLLDLLLNMFNQNESKRINMLQILQHKFFIQFKKQTEPKLKRKSNGHQNSALLNLMRFKIRSQLQSILWMYLSLNRISSSQKCQYITQFYNLDRNHDGKLSRQQILQSLTNTFNLSEELALNFTTSIFTSIDKNHSEFLQYSQFVMATSLISKHITQEEVQKIFKEIDYNHDGQICQQELEMILGGIQGAGYLLKGRENVDLKQFKILIFDIFQYVNAETQHI